MKKIEPTLASGFKDYLPEEMIPRQGMLDTIRQVFETFGFLPLDTPSIEKEEILTGDDEAFNKQIFRLASNAKDKETSGLALRFDLTVPLARVVAANSEIGRPFKRYQIAKVFRAESAQMGRFKEFTQCDIDIIGSDSHMADAEIISVIYSTLKALDAPPFVIKINSRKILGQFIYGLVPSGNPHNFINVLRIVDKQDKIGTEGVKSELGKLKLTADQVSAIVDFITFRAQGSPREISEKLSLTQPADSLIAREGIDDLLRILGNLEALGVKDSLEVDFSIARGLGYYTSTVFETVLTGFPEIGSIFSGGRYDGLIERYSKDKVPAVGASIGIDRLFAALQKMDKIRTRKKTAEVLVLNFDGSSAVKVQEAAADLRRAGIKTEVYLGKEETFKGQLAYAVKNEYPVVVIIGPKEIGSGKAQIKDMLQKTQQEAAFADLTEEVKKIIDGRPR